MAFSCYQCSSQFDIASQAIRHLRKTHNVKEYVIPEQIKCLTKNCVKKFMTFSGLKKHLVGCFEKVILIITFNVSATHR